MEIKKGTRWVCINDVLMQNSREIVYVKGDVYTSEQDRCITNKLGEIGHWWPNDEYTNEYFIPYSKLDRVYTKYTERLEKLFDAYDGKKYRTRTATDKILFFDNCDTRLQTGCLCATDMSEEYYNDENYTYLSEQAFIEFMNLGKYVGNLKVESEGFNKEELEIVSDVIDECIYGKEVDDYLKITEEWSKEGDGLEEVFNPKPYYDNSNGSLFQLAEQLQLNHWEFDILKRLVRCRKKGQFKEDLQKIKDTCDIYLQEYK